MYLDKQINVDTIKKLLYKAGKCRRAEPSHVN